MPRRAVRSVRDHVVCDLPHRPHAPHTAPRPRRPARRLLWGPRSPPHPQALRRHPHPLRGLTTLNSYSIFPLFRDSNRFVIRCWWWPFCSLGRATGVGGGGGVHQEGASGARGSGRITIQVGFIGSHWLFPFPFLNCLLLIGEFWFLIGWFTNCSVWPIINWLKKSSYGELYCYAAYLTWKIW